MVWNAAPQYSIPVLEIQKITRCQKYLHTPLLSPLFFFFFCLFILNEGQGTEVKRVWFLPGGVSALGADRKEGRSERVDFAGRREWDDGRLRGQQEPGEKGMMGVSLLSDGQQGSLSKQQISMLPCSTPPPPFLLHPPPDPSA